MYIHTDTAEICAFERAAEAGRVECCEKHFAKALGPYTGDEADNRARAMLECAVTFL